MRTPKEVRKGTYLLLLSGVLVAFGGIALELVPVIKLGEIIIALSVIHHIIFYRCPHCGKFLDRSTGEYCPQCGKKLNKPE